MGLLNNRHSFIRAFILLVTTSSLLIVASPAQVSDKIETIHVTTRVVNLNVVVTDKEGNPVKDLKKEDFTIFDGGKPQKIGFFSSVDDQSVQHLSPLPLDTYTNDLSVTGAPSSVTILVFDTAKTSYYDQSYGLSRIRKFLHQVGPQEHIGIYVLGDELKVVHDFSRDSLDLLSAIQRYEDNKKHRTTMASPVGLTSSDLELDRFLSGKELNYHNRYRSRSNYQLSNVSIFQNNDAWVFDIANQLASVPGRKSIVWMGDGAPLSFVSDHASEFLGLGSSRSIYQMTSYSPEHRDNLDRLVRLMNNSGIAFYTADSRGLQTFSASSWSPPMIDLQASSPANYPLSLSPVENIPIPSPDGDSLEMTARTGGRAYYNGNDPEASIRSALNDSRFNYAVGFYPDHNQWNGRWRKIKVKVNRPGLKVLTRGGYLALPDPTPPAPKSRLVYLNQVAFSPIPATQLPVSVHIAADSAKDAAKLDAIVKLDPQRLLTNQENGNWIGNFETLYFQLDDKNKILDVTTQTAELNLKPAEFQQVVQKGLNMHGRLSFKQGATLLCVILHDKKTDAVGSVRIPLSQYSAKLNWNAPVPVK